MTTKSDWTTPIELTETEKATDEISKLIFTGTSTRDQALALVMVTLTVAHAEKTERGLFIDLLDASLRFVRSACDEELLRFLAQELADAPSDLPVADVRRLLVSMSQLSRAATLKHGNEAKKLAQLISLAKEPD